MSDLWGKILSYLNNIRQKKIKKNKINFISFNPVKIEQVISKINIILVILLILLLGYYFKLHIAARELDNNLAPPVAESKLVELEKELEELNYWLSLKNETKDIAENPLLRAFFLAEEIFAEDGGFLKLLWQEEDLIIQGEAKNFNSYSNIIKRVAGYREREEEILLERLSYTSTPTFNLKITIKEGENNETAGYQN